MPERGGGRNVQDYQEKRQGRKLATEQQTITWYEKNVSQRTSKTKGSDQHRRGNRSMRAISRDDCEKGGKRRGTDRALHPRH